MSKPACLTWTVDGSGLDDWHRDECAMCGGSATIAGRMVMDHDHATGLNRGWLCRSCNSVEPHAETPWWVAWRAGQNPAGMLGVEEPYVHLMPGAAWLERAYAARLRRRGRRDRRSRGALDHATRPLRDKALTTVDP
jgi:hypothetical protein